MLAASLSLYIEAGELVNCTSSFVIDRDYSWINNSQDVTQLLKDLSRSLLGRLVSLGIFALGFWVLYQGLLRDDNLHFC